MDFNLIQAAKGGWFFVSILVGASIVSCTIMVDRILALRRTKIDSERFARMVQQLLKEQGRDTAVSFCAKHREPIAEVVGAMLVAKGARDERERAYRHMLRICVRSLQTRVPWLGTIGSTAPFVGLLGTVWGIMKTFRDIGASAGGGPDVVAAGISEALITTALGLVVAIPAVVAYNAFSTQVKRLAEEADLITAELLDEVMRLEEGRS